MNSRKIILALLSIFALTTVAFAQDKTKGGIKGKLRAEDGSDMARASVIVRQGEREVARTETDRKGQFSVGGLQPGVYGLTFRKSGFSVGNYDGVEVRAGKTRSLPDRLYMKVDEGTLAFVRGSVFRTDGRSFQGARVEIALINADGSTKRLDERITGETGQFVFRLQPDVAKYRLTVKADGAETTTKDVEVDGAAIYRVAITLQPSSE